MKSWQLRGARRKRRTLLLLALALLVFGVLVAVAPLTEIDYWGIDLYTFRAGAKAMMAGADPYDVSNIPRFADGVEVGNIHNYLYAPYFAFAMRPFTWISPEAASRLWFALNLVLYFLSVSLILLAIRWSPKPAVFLSVIVGSVLFPPLRTTLIIGQSTILMLFFFAASLFLLRQQRPLLSGLIFSLGLFKPHLLPLLLFFLFYQQWRWLASVGLGLLLLNVPLMTWLDNWYVSASSTRTANLAVDQCFQMVSLVSLLNCTLPWSDYFVIFILAVGSVALLTGVYWTTPAANPPTRQPDRIFDRHLAIFITISLLLIDHTRIADQMLLLFPLFVAWRDWSLLDSVWRRRAAICITFVIYLLPYSLDILGASSVAYLLPFWYIALSGAVLILLLLEWMSSRETYEHVK